MPKLLILMTLALGISLSGCGGGGSSPASNQAPTANAGADQSADEGTAVNLSATGADGDGTIVSFSWQQESGTAVSITNANMANASFVAPMVAASEVLLFRVTVTDDDGATGSDTVTVTVNNVPIPPPPPPNQAPSADAGADQNVPTGATVQLDGSASSDPESDPLTYSWSLTTPAGSTASLSDANIVNPTFVADVDGDYVTTLVVNDGTSDSAPDSATITATEVHYYLSLGTSLSVGIQPDASGANQLTDDGYADQLFDIIKPLFDIIEPETLELQLLKLGCPGETTTTMINGGICAYSEASQLDEAVAFLNVQKDKVELITIDMGANDLLEAGCLVGTAIDFDCINDVSMQISIDLPVILSALRGAADPGTPIVAMNYYNPFLAFWLLGMEGQVLAMDSALAVSILNGDMGLTYAQFNIPVADVAGAFQSDDFVTIVPSPLPPPNDFIPLNVATICLLTYMCEPDPVGPNIHANPTGYGVIAATFAAILP